MLIFQKHADVRGRGSENSDRCGQGGWGKKMGKNLRTSFNDGPLDATSLILKTITMLLLIIIITWGGFPL